MIIPTLRYRDTRKAVQWLQDVFHFEKHAVHEDTNGQIVHAEMKFGVVFIMLGQVADTPFGKHMIQPDEIDGRNTMCTYIVMPEEDLVAHYEKAVSKGAGIIDPLTVKDYGGSGYSVRDYEGFIWSFGSYDPRSTAEK